MVHFSTALWYIFGLHLTDGSYYTPSYITEYMANSTIEKAIITKFNLNGFDGNTIDEIGDNIPRGKLSEALEIFNTITICDPAIILKFSKSTINSINYKLSA